MASVYPGAIDTLPIPSGSATLGGSTPTHQAVHQAAADAILAVQNELGVNPSGSDATVLARLNRMEGTVLAHATTHGSAGSDPVTPAAIGAETPTGATTKINTHITSGHPLLYSNVKGGTTPPGWWYRASSAALPTSGEGAVNGDICVVYPG